MPGRLRQTEADFLDLTQSRSADHLGSLRSPPPSKRPSAVQADAGNRLPDRRRELESRSSKIFNKIDQQSARARMRILCAPSGSLSGITDLASCVYRPERCVALRGNLAPPKDATNPPLCLLHPNSTTPAILSATVDLFTALGFAVHPEPDPDVPMLLKNLNPQST